MKLVTSVIAKTGSHKTLYLKVWGKKCSSVKKQALGSIASTTKKLKTF